MFDNQTCAAPTHGASTSVSHAASHPFLDGMGDFGMIRV